MDFAARLHHFATCRNERDFLLRLLEFTMENNVPDWLYNAVAAAFDQADSRCDQAGANLYPDVAVQSG